MHLWDNQEVKQSPREKDVPQYILGPFSGTGRELVWASVWGQILGWEVGYPVAGEGDLVMEDPP